MSARAATVIAGVSLYRVEQQRQGDRFDLALSTDGIEIRRPGQATRRLSWDHVTEWEIQDWSGGALLTLRGGGAVTPLLVPSWTADELEVALRDAAAGATALPQAAPTATAPTATAPTAAAPEVAAPDAVAPEAVAPEAADAPDPAQARPASRGARLGPPRFERWKVIVTVSLLALLATAVTLVLLQSAGIIHLGFLGPTA